MPTVILLLDNALWVVCTTLAAITAGLLAHELLCRAGAVWASWQKARHDRRTYRYTWTKHPHWLRRR